MTRHGRDPRLSLEQSQRLSKARILGQSRTLPIYLEDSELIKIISIVLSDTDNFALGHHLPAFATRDYYSIPLEWFGQQEPIHTDLIDLYLHCVREVRDFETYFENLCELHKRRRKYAMILSSQPMPTMLQVSPRALLEFGTIATPALVSWLVWRKWFYDIDNRAAQETGYLFEPILASALGGIPYGARNSPIRRESDDAKGRQVDCIVGRFAYEFKLRVTIAASGQGRFQEELDFARDCALSGYMPILLVLDPTPNHRLEELKVAFEASGGRAYIGDEAWKHIEDEAGETMATFVEKYVRRPIATLDQHSIELLDLHIARAKNGGELQFQLGAATEGQTYSWSIMRAENQSLADDTE
jgi:hypothetical protein